MAHYPPWDEMRSIAVLGAVGLAVLAACGGDNTGPMTPSSAPTSRVVSQGTFSLGRLVSARAPNSLCDAVAFIAFDTTVIGKLDAVVDWTFPENDLDVAIISGSCSCEDVLTALAFEDFERCPTIAESVSTTAKPESVSASNAAAGNYTLVVVNWGQAVESCSYEVILTTTT